MKRKIRLSPRFRDKEKNCPLAWISVRSRYGDFAPIHFCIDTGAGYSALTIPIARQEGITYPQAAVARGTASGLVGQVVRYRGVIQVRLFDEDFTWPCDFLDTAGPASVEPYGVIGRAGFVDDFAFCLDKPFFTLRRRGPMWRRLLTSLFPPWTPEHHFDQPL